MDDRFYKLVMKYHDVITKAETVSSVHIKHELYTEARKLQKLINGMINPSSAASDYEVQKENLIRWIETWE